MDQAITRAAGATLSTTTRAAAPRTWSLLLTSQNHGVVGVAGSQFGCAAENYERVQVMEIVEAGAPPAPGANLAGLVRLPLTNEQIAAGAAIECDHGAPIGRNAAIDVFDAINGAAPVAAQAGQVAVPEGWKLVPVEPTLDMVTHGFESAPDEFFSPTEEWEAYAEMTGCQKAAHRAKLCWAAMLAAAPSAPAVVQQAPAPIDGQVAWSIDLQARLITASQDIAADEDARQVMAEAACLLASLTGAQASTASERQPEGGAA